MKKVVAIHTAMALVNPLTELFKEHLPEVKLNHIADDSLIQEVIANNEVTPTVRKRLLSYYFAAVDSGADIILNMCSSVGEVAESGRLCVSVPLLRIDDPMAIKAVESGVKIGVLATLPTTLQPTVKLLTNKAKELNKTIEIIDGLAEGAFQAAMSGDVETHNKLIVKASERVATQADVIVLAQGSMAKMETELARITGKTVLSSPLSGTLAVKIYL